MYIYKHITYTYCTNMIMHMYWWIDEYVKYGFVTARCPSKWIG